MITYKRRLYPMLHVHSPVNNNIINPENQGLPLQLNKLIAKHSIGDMKYI